jgi:hypothetical protein
MVKIGSTKMVPSVAFNLPENYRIFEHFGSCHFSIFSWSFTEPTKILIHWTNWNHYVQVHKKSITWLYENMAPWKKHSHVSFLHPSAIFDPWIYPISKLWFVRLTHFHCLTYLWTMARIYIYNDMYRYSIDDSLWITY